MASTYTTGLRLEKPGHGDYEDTWDEVVNAQLDLIDEMEATATAISTTGGDTTLSTNNGATDQARPRIYRVTGTLASDANIIVPAISRLIYVVNGTSGAYNVNVKTASGSALAVPQGESRWLLSHTDNTVVFAAPPKTTGTSLLKGDNVGGFAAAAEGTDYYGPAGTDVAVTDGGTGASDASGARTNLGLVIGTNVQAYNANLTTWAGIAPSANGQSLVAAANYAAMRTLLDLEAGTDFYSISAADSAIATAVASYTLTTDLAATTTGKGASLIGIEDSGTLITATTVEGALAENRAAIDAIEADYLTSGAIGVSVQAYNANLTTWAGIAPSANGQSLVAAANYAAMRTLLDLEAGTDFLSPAAIAAAYQPLDAELTSLAGASANGVSLVTAANYAAMRTLLDLEAGTDFYSISAADAAFQPLDADLTAIAALTTTAAGRSILGLIDPNADRVMIWDDSGGALVAATLGGGLFISGTGLYAYETIVVACSDETTALTTGTAKVTFRMPFAMTLTAVRASVTTAPTGSALTVDINEGGTTILSTKLTIDATEKTSTTAATAAVISDASLADDAEMTIDIDAVGSTIAGAGLKVSLIGYRS